MRFLTVLKLVALGLSVMIPWCAMAQSVQITNMNDISFGTWSGTADLQLTDDVCVYNFLASGFNITASGSGPGGSFELTNGGMTVPFVTGFRPGTAAFTTLTSGVSQGFTSADSLSSNCSGGTNATFRITIAEAALFAAGPGSFSGGLTILLEP